MATDWTQDANCVGAWLFTEGSGTSLADSSGDNRNGTFKGDGEPAWSSTVPQSYTPYSLDFDGSDDYVSASSPVLNGDISFTTWIRLDSFSGRFLSNRSGLNGFDGNTSGTSIRVFINGTTGVEPSGYSTNTWYHVAFTKPDSLSDAKLYVDGVEAASSERNDINAGGDIQFGRRWDNTSFHNGLQSETAIFTTTLDSTDINDIRDNGLKQATSTIKRRLLMGIGI